MKGITKTIEKLELIKVEKNFNKREQQYFYNIYLEGIDEPLLIGGLNEQITQSIVGSKIKYKLNEDNEVKDFEVI